MIEDLLFSIGGRLIDKILPSEDVKQEAQKELAAMVKSGELKDLELRVQDRMSARSREMVVKDGANMRIGAMILFGFFTTLVALFWVPVQSGMKDTLLLMIGALGTMATQVVAYYFGSSSGSHEKTKMLSGKS